MTANMYVNIEYRANPSEGLSNPVIGNGVMRALHPIFREHTDKFALALPELKPNIVTGKITRLRIFSSCSQDMTLLMSLIEKSPNIRDYCKIGEPSSVPDDFSGCWIEYRLYRIPDKNANDRSGPDGGKLRVKRMAHAKALMLPFFHVLSKSGGTRYTVIVEARDGVEKKGDISTNSYGLSTSTRCLALPAL